MTGAVVAVMARAPSSNGKSRLIRDLGTSDETGLRAALLRDTLESISALEGGKAVLYIPPEGEAELRALTPFPATFLPQRGATLGDRMLHGIGDLLIAGFDRVVLIGSDLPTLPAAHVTAALDILKRRPDAVVLGPAEDGGYYLIGLTQPRPELFPQIPWGTPSVLQRTCDAADALGIPVERLPGWYDVDSISDLRRVWHAAEAPNGAARHTQAWLAAAPAPVRVRVDSDTI
jgi:rSAM/selenodomain-associated transferase 1